MDSSLLADIRCCGTEATSVGHSSRRAVHSFPA